MANKSDIFNKYDKYIKNGVKTCKECNQVIPNQDIVFRVSDEDWNEHLNSLDPVSKINVETYGFNTVEYKGHTYETLGYKRYPFIRQSDVDNNRFIK